MDTIGKYQLVRIIGEGGMGRVYEAIDPIIGRRVAVKTISLSVATDAETRSRFFREAQAAGQLSHPNLITIHDIGDADGTPYIVMEFLEGVDLNRKIQRDFLSYDAKMQIIIDVCEGLSFAHAHDIVGVRERQPLAHVDDDLHLRVVGEEVPLDLSIQIHALEKLHHDIRSAVRVADVVNRNQVGVGELPG